MDRIFFFSYLLAFCSLIANTIVQVFFSVWVTPLAYSVPYFIQILVYLAIILIPIIIVSNITKDFNKCIKLITKLGNNLAQPIGPIFGGSKSYGINTIIFFIINLLIQPKIMIEVYKLLHGQSQQSPSVNLEVSANITKWISNLTGLLYQQNLLLAKKENLTLNDLIN